VGTDEHSLKKKLFRVFSLL